MRLKSYWFVLLTRVVVLIGRICGEALISRGFILRFCYMISLARGIYDAFLSMGQFESDATFLYSVWNVWIVSLRKTMLLLMISSSCLERKGFSQHNKEEYSSMLWSYSRYPFGLSKLSDSWFTVLIRSLGVELKPIVVITVSYRTRWSTFIFCCYTFDHRTPGLHPTTPIPPLTSVGDTPSPSGLVLLRRL